MATESGSWTITGAAAGVAGGVELGEDVEVGGVELGEDVEVGGVELGEDVEAVLPALVATGAAGVVVGMVVVPVVGVCVASKAVRWWAAV